MRHGHGSSARLRGSERSRSPARSRDPRAGDRARGDRRAEAVQIAARAVPVATPEDLIIYKAVAWRDRDRSDVERLLVQHSAEIDLSRIRRIVREFADALGLPERSAQFEAVVRRATRK